MYLSTAYYRNNLYKFKDVSVNVHMIRNKTGSVEQMRVYSIGESCLSSFDIEFLSEYPVRSLSIPPLYLGLDGGNTYNWLT
jgi:hypothetical protein